MRLAVGGAGALAGAILGLSLAAAQPAAAQMGGMNCFAMAGGRSACGPGISGLSDRLNGDAADRRAAREARRKAAVRRIAEAVQAHRCVEALDLATRLHEPAVTADTARLCGVPEAGSAAAPGPSL